MYIFQCNFLGLATNNNLPSSAFVKTSNDRKAQRKNIV